MSTLFYILPHVCPIMLIHVVVFIPWAGILISLVLLCLPLCFLIWYNFTSHTKSGSQVCVKFSHNKRSRLLRTALTGGPWSHVNFPLYYNYCRLPVLLGRTFTNDLWPHIKAYKNIPSTHKASKSHIMVATSASLHFGGLGRNNVALCASNGCMF